MDSFICRHCEARVPAGARACPKCGSDYQTGWATTPAAAGLYDDDERPAERLSATPAWMKIALGGVLLVFVSGILLSAGRWGIYAVPVVALVLGWVYLAPALDFSWRPGGGERQLYQRLLTKARGDASLAARLIEHEQRRTPNASRAQLIQSAIYRWERDNR